MSKLTLPAILILLQILSAASNGGVDQACKKAPDAKFCASLLQPFASQLSDADGLKMGLAAMNATLGRVNDLREYMVHGAVQDETTPEELETLGRCLSNVGNGEGAITVALQTLNETRGADREELTKMIHTATTELTICIDSLKKHIHDDVIRKALTLTDDTVRACFVAQALLP